MPKTPISKPAREMARAMVDGLSQEIKQEIIQSAIDDQTEFLAKDQARLDWAAKHEAAFRVERGAAGYADKWTVWKRGNRETAAGTGETLRHAINDAMTRFP